MVKRVLLPVMAAILGLSACSQVPKAETKKEGEAKKEPVQAPQAVTAQLAFYAAYKPARAWATDLLALSVVSGEVPGIKNDCGKAGLWTVTFVSPSRKEARIFTYAVANSGADIRKGINISDALPWGGATKESNPFANSEFAVDSDAACKAAEEKAADWLKKHPDQKVTLRLGNASRFAAPVWYIMWGTTKNGYAALVNAVTGAVLK